MRFTKNLRKKLTTNSRKTYDSNLAVVKSILLSSLMNYKSFLPEHKQ